jgi:hypothetical protein
MGEYCRPTVTEMKRLYHASSLLIGSLSYRTSCVRINKRLFLMASCRCSIRSF